jgi:hypothetical protein
MLAFCTWDNSSVGLNLLHQDALTFCQPHCSYRKTLAVRRPTTKFKRFWLCNSNDVAVPIQKHIQAIFVQLAILSSRPNTGRPHIGLPKMLKALSCKMPLSYSIHNKPIAKFKPASRQNFNVGKALVHPSRGYIQVSTKLI